MMALGSYALLEARIAKLEEMAHPPVAIPLGELEARIEALETAAQTPADGLHPETAAALERFVAALRTKLVLAQLKHGYTDEWRTDDWEVECQQQLELHVMKGDPLDVAAYCLFCFARGWSTRIGYARGPEGPPIPAAVPEGRDAVLAAVADWIERRRKALSKSGITHGHYHADLCTLEADIEAVVSKEGA